MHTNVTLAKEITKLFVTEYPELGKAQEVVTDLHKGEKLDEKKEEMKCLEGLRHHLSRAKWKGNSLEDHEEKVKKLPEIKKAKEEHTKRAKAFAKKLGIPEKEITDEIENKTNNLNKVSYSEFEPHYNDEMLSK